VRRQERRDRVHRYYDPQNGQFLTTDSLEEETGAPYSYALDDPVTNIDPNGLCARAVAPLVRGPAAGRRVNAARAVLQGMNLIINPKLLSSLGGPPDGAGPIEVCVPTPKIKKIGKKYYRTYLCTKTYPDGRTEEYFIEFEEDAIEDPGRPGPDEARSWLGPSVSTLGIRWKGLAIS